MVVRDVHGVRSAREVILSNGWTPEKKGDISLYRKSTAKLTVKRMIIALVVERIQSRDKSLFT